MRKCMTELDLRWRYFHLTEYEVQAMWGGWTAVVGGVPRNQVCILSQSRQQSLEKN